MLLFGKNVVIEPFNGTNWSWAKELYTSEINSGKMNNFIKKTLATLA